MQSFQVVVLNSDLGNSNGNLITDPNHRFLLTLFADSVSQYGRRFCKSTNAFLLNHKDKKTYTKKKPDKGVEFLPSPIKKEERVLSPRATVVSQSEIEPKPVSFSGDCRAFYAASEPVELSLWNSHALESHGEQYLIQHTIKTSNVIIYLFPLNDNSILESLPKIASKFTFMEEAAFFLVGWLPDECEGKDLQGSVPENTNRVVTKEQITEVGKKLGPEGYYQIKLGGPYDSLNFVVARNEGFKSIEAREKENIQAYLERSGISGLRDAVIRYTSDVCHSIPSPFAGRKRKPVPAVFADSMAFLSENGLNISQLFCLPGRESQQLINSVYTKYLRGKRVDLQKLGVDPHTVAGLLKKFLRSSTTDPLLTAELYDLFLSIADVPVGFRKTTVDAYFSVLPVENRYMLVQIIELLSNIVCNQERTHVDSLQLARVLAPCFIHSDSQNHGKTASNQIKLTQVMQLLIENREYLVEVWLPKQSDLVTSQVEESKSISSFFGGGSKEALMGKVPRRRSLTKRNFMHRLRKHNSNDEDEKKNIAAYTASHSLRDSDKGILPEHQYARDGNLELLNESLETHPFLLKAKDDLGNTLLHYATMGVDGYGEKSYAVAQYLISRDPELQFMQRWGDGKTPLHVAIDAGKSGKQLVRMFMEQIKDKESELTRRTRNGKTVLHYAARNDCLESVTLLASCLAARLIEALHLQDGNGCTPLHYAVRNDNFGQGGPAQQSQLIFLIRKLASQQAIECRDLNGQTPLHYAVQRKGESVKLIIPILATSHSTLLGADVEGRTPLHIAVLQNSIDSVEQILKSASSLGMLKLVLAARDTKGRTCLHYAAQQHFVDLVGRVVGDEEIANLPDFQGSTALHLATATVGNSIDSFDQIQVLSVLATNSTSINSMDKLGRTPLHYANTAEEVQCLCSLGAIVNIQDFEGISPFMLAVEESRMDVANALRNLGAVTTSRTDLRNSGTF